MALGAAVAVVAATASGQEPGEIIEAQLEVAEDTETVLEDKRDARTDTLRTRVRAAYKLFRAGHAPLWVDADARGELARRRGAARRILARDLRERRLLGRDLDEVRAARARLEVERDRADRVGAAAPGSIVRPVPGSVVREFGRYRHRATGAILSRRGVSLEAGAGQPVRAPVSGEVRFVGELRNLGLAAVIAGAEPGAPIVVVAGLSRARVSPGEALTRGQAIGRAAGSVYLEVRVAIAGSTYPVDPARLFAR